MNKRNLTVNYGMIVLVAFTLIISAYSTMIPGTISPEIYIPEDVLKKDDVLELLSKKDLSELTAKNDIKEFIKANDLSSLEEDLETVKSSLESLKEEIVPTPTPTPQPTPIPFPFLNIGGYVLTNGTVYLEVSLSTGHRGRSKATLDKVIVNHIEYSWSDGSAENATLLQGEIRTWQKEVDGPFHPGEFIGVEIARARWPDTYISQLRLC